MFCVCACAAIKLRGPALRIAMFHCAARLARTASRPSPPSRWPSSHAPSSLLSPCAGYALPLGVWAVVKRCIMQKSPEDNKILQQHLARERGIRELADILYILSPYDGSGFCCDSITDAINKTHPDCLTSLWNMTQNPQKLNIKLPHLKKEQPLHLAACFNSSSMVIALERKGHNVNCVNQQLLAPLHIAASIEGVDVEIIRYLLLKGANAMLEDMNGRTALHYAAYAGNTEAVRLLLPHSSAGRNPTFACCFRKFLLENGANPRATTLEQGTALHFAALKTDLKSLEILLKYKVDVNAKDLEGSTPLHIACVSDSLECAKVLLEHGAKVNELDKECVTPLHHAAFKGNSQLVRLLIQKGADPCILFTNEE